MVASPADAFDLHEEVALGPRLITRTIDIAGEHDDFLLARGEEGIVDKGACHEVAEGAPTAAGFDAIAAVELHLAPYERSKVFPILHAALDAGVAAVGTGRDMAFHDGVEAVEDVLLVEHILVGVREHIYQDTYAEVFGLFAHPCEVLGLFGQREFVGEHEAEAKFLADKVVEFMVFHALESLVNTAMFGSVYVVEDAFLIFEKHLVEGGAVFHCKVEDYLRGGILVDVHIDFVGIVGMDVKNQDVAMVLEHLGASVR